jgi:hypothetical protein
MIETGIPKLDNFLGGGIPDGKSLLYYIQPGVVGEVFGMQTLYHNLRKGVKGLYITITTDPHTIRTDFKDFGWDLKKYEDKFAIIDAYSRLVGINSKERYVVEKPQSLESFASTLKMALEEFSGGAITFGSISSIIDMAGEEEGLKFIKKWNKYNVLNDNVGIANFTAWPYSAQTLKAIKEDLFNAVIEISGIAKRVIFGQYYALMKADWADTKKNAILFRLAKPGGIRAYVPKILVTGPYNAGKSTFVHAISDWAVSVDRLSTTVALDRGHIDRHGFSADIFGTPGQERFDPIIKLLGGEALGVFLVVDSTDPSTFVRGKKMLELTASYGLPYLVVANKQDLKGALDPEEIRSKMKIPKDVPILPVVSTEKRGVDRAFEVLIDMIEEGA